MGLSGFYCLRQNGWKERLIFSCHFYIDDADDGVKFLLDDERCGKISLLHFLKYSFAFELSDYLVVIGKVAAHKVKEVDAFASNLYFFYSCPHQ